MLLLAPIVWFIGFWAFLQGVPGGLGLFTLSLLALVGVVAGIGLLIYGLVAKSDLKRAALARQVTRNLPPGRLM